MSQGHVASTQWSISWNEASLRLLCRSLYINLPPPHLFSTFLRNFMIRVLLSPLLDKHTVHLVHPSFTPFCCSSPTGKLGESLKSRRSFCGRSQKIRKRRSRTGSFRRKRRRYVSIVTPTPSLLNLEAHLQKVLTTPSVRLRLPIQTWTCLMSILTPRPRLQFNSSTLRARMICLLTTTLVETKSQLKLRSSRMAPVSLMSLLQKRRLKVLLPNSSFFFWQNCKDLKNSLNFNLTIVFYSQTSPFMGLSNI